jgi:hypothetical protein
MPPRLLEGVQQQEEEEELWEDFQDRLPLARQKMGGHKFV